MYFNSPQIRNGKGRYGTLFSESMTLRGFLNANHDTVREICKQQADEIYLGKDPKTLIRDAMRDLIEEDSIPNLLLDGAQPDQQTHISGFVGVLYRIRVDKDPQTLKWKLPDHLEETSLSEYATIDKNSFLPSNANRLDEIQHLLELQYSFPQDVWDSGKSGLLQQQVASDVEWLKAVIDDYHAAFTENAKALEKLIHIEILDKWQIVMDVAGEVASAPLPEEDSDGPLTRQKNAGYKMHQNYLFGQQEGMCNGCRRRFCYEKMTVDHIVPRSKDGGNELPNLQLLCQPCNNLKADDSHEDLLLRLATKKPTNPSCCQC